MCHLKVTLSSMILWRVDGTSLQNTSQAKCSLSNGLNGKGSLVHLLKRALEDTYKYL